MPEGLRAGDPAGPLPPHRETLSPGRGDGLRGYWTSHCVLAPKLSPAGSVTGLPSGPVVPRPWTSGQAWPPASGRTPPPSPSSFLSSFLSPASGAQQPQASSGAGGRLRGRCVLSPRAVCPAPVGRGGGRASALAPLLHPVRDPVSSRPLGDPGSLGVARGLPHPPTPQQASGEQVSAVSPGLTAPSAAAYLCPDSVLVAEDGAVLFGPPPANGGYRRARLTLGCVPTSATNL